MLVAIDIGNTNILIGVIDPNGSILSQLRISTVDFLDENQASKNIFLDLIKK